MDIAHLLRSGWNGWYHFRSACDRLSAESCAEEDGLCQHLVFLRIRSVPSQPAPQENDLHCDSRHETLENAGSLSNRFARKVKFLRRSKVFAVCIKIIFYHLTLFKASWVERSRRLLDRGWTSVPSAS